ncbi:hypothetical protein NDU88_006666 [Pleurodeles waltl]|uniref:Uncharacterized protein n=1 Tax=Pleurodeles waltl TaxID=8319 RepID=A0AAV7WGA3_PLEWA|nr:hypothetical protein NDU88_006666 [Pleurodeles waltl]
MLYSGVRNARTLGASSDRCQWVHLPQLQLGGAALPQPARPVTCSRRVCGFKALSPLQPGQSVRSRAAAEGGAAAGPGAWTRLGINRSSLGTGSVVGLGEAGGAAGTGAEHGEYTASAHTRPGAERTGVHTGPQRML